MLELIREQGLRFRISQRDIALHVYRGMHGRGLAIMRKAREEMKQLDGKRDLRSLRRWLELQEEFIRGDKLCQRASAYHRRWLRVEITDE